MIVNLPKLKRRDWGVYWVLAGVVILVIVGIAGARRSQKINDFCLQAFASARTPAETLYVTNQRVDGRRHCRLYR